MCVLATLVFRFLCLSFCEFAEEEFTPQSAHPLRLNPKQWHTQNNTSKMQTNRLSSWGLKEEKKGSRSSLYTCFEVPKQTLWLSQYQPNSLLSVGACPSHFLLYLRKHFQRVFTQQGSLNIIYKQWANQKASITATIFFICSFWEYIFLYLLKKKLWWEKHSRW